MCGVCEVRVPRSRFPGNLAVVSETVGVSSHRELPNQTFVRATPTISVNACIGVPGSGEVLARSCGLCLLVGLEGWERECV